jgi:hypothetical protein
MDIEFSRLQMRIQIGYIPTGTQDIMRRVQV